MSRIELLPLTEAEKTALLTAVIMVLQSMKVPQQDPITAALLSGLKAPLESVTKKLKS